MSTIDLSLFYLPTYRDGFTTSLTDFYEELIGSVKLADKLGWSRVLTTEHHFHYYGGAVPNPAVFLAAIARETERIRVSAGVSLVPLRHPLQVAEDYALVDHLSGGRFDMGVSRGFVPHEFEAFHVSQAESGDRVTEALEVIQKFWKGEPFAHDGQFWNFQKVEPWPLPKNPDIPIWVAASNSRDSFERAGRAGYRLMMNQYPMSQESLFEKHNWYKETYEASGHDVSKRQSMVNFMAYLADTEEEAIATAQAALQEHVTAFGKVLNHQEWDTNYEGDISALTRMSETGDVLDTFRRRTLICSVEQAAERLARYLEDGFTEIGITARYASLTAEQERETIQRMSEQVLPMLGLSTGNGAAKGAVAAE